jgi:hypothetical protein
MVSPIRGSDGPPENSRIGNGRMTADIIILQVERVRQNRCFGARENLIDVALNLPNGTQDAETWTDCILAELWTRGFKVVPVDEA